MAKGLAQELQKAEPVLAAKAPTAAAAQVRPHVGKTTPKLLAETDGLVVGRETQSAVSTAQVGMGEAGGRANGESIKRISSKSDSDYSGIDLE